MERRVGMFFNRHLGEQSGERRAFCLGDKREERGSRVTKRRRAKGVVFENGSAWLGAWLGAWMKHLAFLV